MSDMREHRDRRGRGELPDTRRPQTSPGKVTLTSRLQGSGPAARAAEPRDGASVQRKALSEAEAGARRVEMARWEAAPLLGIAPETSVQTSEDHAGEGTLHAQPVQRKAASGEASAADPRSALARAQESAGQAVDDRVRSKVEAATAEDLSGVRVHTGSSSTEAARAVAARAYTVGQDIHFGAGEYAPGTREGDRLIAHELVHTVQQRAGRGGTAQTKLTISDPADGAEREADAVADAVVDEGVAPPIRHTGSAVARQAEEGPAEEDAEKLLAEAIQVIEDMLRGVAESGAESVGTAGPAQQQGGAGDAAAAEEVPAPESQGGSRLEPEKEAQLQVALANLQALHGSGADEIRAAALPIVRAARGLEPSAPPASVGHVQRATLALAAPAAAAAGPPGWALLAAGAVVTGVLLYRSRKRSRARAEPRVEARPRTTEPPVMHMGNIHVQGDDISGTVPNFPWNRATPMTTTEALAGLATVRGMLSPRQLSFRDVAFAKAANFIKATLYSAPPPLFRSFLNPEVANDKDLGTRRVDVEIIRGQAFV